MAASPQDAQYQKMVETPVPGLVVKLAIPSIITMIISSVYNMADTFFVSKLGTSAAGAVGVVFSLMSIIQAVGFTLGMGSGSLVSRQLGARDKAAADTTASVGFFSALAFGACLTLFGTLFRTQLVHFLGATETMQAQAEAYAAFILYAAPLMCATFQMNNILRSEGKSALGSFAVTTGGVLNMLLDPLFIFGLDLGITGAALATALSQCVSFAVMLSMYLSGRSAIRLSLRLVPRGLPVLLKIFTVGSPSLCRQGLASLASVFLNRSVRIYGDAAVAAMNIISRVTHFQGSVMRGLGQGCQPVTGFNFGARRFDRVCAANRFTVVASTVFMAAVSAAIFLWAPDILNLFRRGDAEVIRIGTFALRAACVAAPLTALVTTTNMTLQSTGRSAGALFLASCRQGIFFLPLICLLPLRYGLAGAQMAQPLADLLTFLVTLPFYFQFRSQMQRLHREEQAEGGAPDACAP